MSFPRMRESMLGQIARPSSFTANHDLTIIKSPISNTKSGSHRLTIIYYNPLKCLWIPAFAGMTSDFISGFWEPDLR